MSAFGKSLQCYGPVSYHKVSMCIAVEDNDLLTSYELKLLIIDSTQLVSASQHNGVNKRI